MAEVIEFCIPRGYSREAAWIPLQNGRRDGVLLTGEEIGLSPSTNLIEEKNMSEHYHDVGDLRFLKEMAKFAPTEFNAWLTLDKIVGREDGTIPRKYRELIALGVAFTTQCPYCIEAHAKAAKAAGASRQEITETALIAAALRAGGAATHGAMALKFYDQP